MNDPEKISEDVVYGWYNHMDKAFSTLFFTAGIGALQFSKQADEIATISLLFFLMLAFSLAKSRDVKRHIERLERYKGGIYMFFIAWLKTPVFLTSAVFLVLIATGMVTPDTLDGFSLKDLLGF